MPYPDSSKQGIHRLTLTSGVTLLQPFSGAYKRAGVEHAQGHVVLGHMGMAFGRVKGFD